MAKAKDFTGQTVGRMFVIQREPNENQRRMWRIKCSCGTERKISAHALNTGTLSCGCLRKEVAAARMKSAAKTHGASKTSWYEIWAGMMKRCYNPKTERWPSYGGKGVSVCQRWHDPWNFFADMGERPPGTSIDRIDPSGDYEPPNCRWADARAQGNNTTRNHWIEFNGIKDTIAGWERRTGISGPTIRKRLEEWSIERTLTTPPITGAKKAAHLNGK